MTQRRALIAVVDDEERVRVALARLLRAAWFEVDLYSTGDLFLESLQHSSPDCAILDHQMPGLSGREVQRVLTRMQSTVPVIVITAYDQPTLREQCLADGAVAYLLKPLRRDTIVAAIECALRRLPPPRANRGSTP